MHALKRRVVVGLATFALCAVAGVALAANQDDTVLNYGYDADSHFFIWNVTSLEIDPDMELLEQTLEEYQAEQFQALWDACGLEGNEYSFSYDPETGALTVEAVEDGGEEGPEDIVCGDFQGGDVTGPNGQVNHGMFMKFFNANFEGGHRGCLVRHIAQSGLGKDDQQVKAGDEAEGEEVEPSLEPVEGSVVFETVAADCQRGKGHGVDKVKGGPPQHVLDKFGGQHPRDSKGKSQKHSGGDD